MAISSSAPEGSGCFHGGPKSKITPMGLEDRAWRNSSIPTDPTPIPLHWTFLLPHHKRRRGLFSGDKSTWDCALQRARGLGNHDLLHAWCWVGPCPLPTPPLSVTISHLVPRTGGARLLPSWQEIGKSFSSREKNKDTDLGRSSTGNPPRPLNSETESTSPLVTAGAFKQLYRPRL